MAKQECMQDIGLTEISEAVLENIMCGVLVFLPHEDDSSFCVTYANRSAAHMERLDRDALIGLSVDELFPAKEDFLLKNVFADALRKGKTVHMPAVYYSRKAVSGWREFLVVPTTRNGILLISLDITEAKTLEEELRHMIGRLNSLLAFLPDATMSVDNYGRIESWNQAMETLTGISRSEALGRHSSKLAEAVFGEGARCLTEVITAADFSLLQQTFIVSHRLEGATLNCEMTLRDENNGTKYLSARATPLFDAGGAIAGAIATYHDMTERREMEEKLRYLSVVDQLTGLDNRNSFEQSLERLNRMEAASVGVLFCDIDGLKFVNDTMGHSIGDCVLKDAARAMREGARPEHMVARVGGDEFAVIVENTTVQYMAELARDIRRRVESAANFPEMPVPINLSVGYAVSEAAYVPLSRILKAADDNMYRDKLSRSKSRHESAVKALLAALEERELNGPDHVRRLNRLLESFAAELGLSETELSHLRLLAQFHDVGTVGISAEVFFKAEPLTKDEVAEIRRHSETGHRIAQYLPDLLPLADDILKHHEWWNGEGYPLGLKGTEIPLTARLLCLADALDAMMCDRPYRKALSAEHAIEQIEKSKGKQFDPDLVDRLLPVMKEYACGLGNLQ